MCHIKCMTSYKKKNLVKSQSNIYENTWFDATDLIFLINCKHEDKWTKKHQSQKWIRVASIFIGSFHKTTSIVNTLLSTMNTCCKLKTAIREPDVWRALMYFRQEGTKSMIISSALLLQNGFRRSCDADAAVVLISNYHLKVKVLLSSHYTEVTCSFPPLLHSVESETNVSE